MFIKTLPKLAYLRLNGRFLTKTRVLAPFFQNLLYNQRPKILLPLMRFRCNAQCIFNCYNKCWFNLVLALSYILFNPTPSFCYEVYLRINPHTVFI